MKSFIYCRKSSEDKNRQILSIKNQRRAIERCFGSATDLEIVDIYEEEASAMKPGRPKFNEMIARIERGEAACIIAWQVSRLARNGTDAAKIMELLAQGKIQDLRFTDFTFENSPAGRMLINIIFAHSTYFSDNLSDNVRTGQTTRVEMGWYPGSLLPGFPGYKRKENSCEIILDRKHAKVIRDAFELLLYHGRCPAEIHRVLRDDWAYTTPKGKRCGGTPLSRNSVYRLLANPFYAGYFRWVGQLHEGKHPPIISKAEHEMVRHILGLAPLTRPQKLTFTYGGIFTCGTCGKAVTAERKRNRYGSEYIYYHCTRVHTSPKCTQPSIEEKSLTLEARTFLNQIHIPEPIAQTLHDLIATGESAENTQHHELVAQHQSKVDGLQRRLQKLKQLYLGEHINEQEYADDRKDLKLQLGVAEEKLSKLTKNTDMFEPAQLLTIISSRAVEWFDRAKETGRRNLLKIVCSNPRLIDKKAILEAAKPFQQFVEICESSMLRGVRDDVRTLSAENQTEIQAQLRAIADTISQPEMEELRKLVEEMEQADETATEEAA